MAPPKKKVSLRNTSKKSASAQKHEPGSTEELIELCKKQISIHEAAERDPDTFEGIRVEKLETLRDAVVAWGMNLEVTEAENEPLEPLEDPEKSAILRQLLSSCHDQIDKIERVEPLTDADMAPLDILLPKFERLFISKAVAARDSPPWKPSKHYVLEDRDEDATWRDPETLSLAERSDEHVQKPPAKTTWSLLDVPEYKHIEKGTGKVGDMARKIKEESEKRYQAHYLEKEAALEAREAAVEKREKEVSLREEKVDKGEKEQKQRQSMKDEIVQGSKQFNAT